MIKKILCAFLFGLVTINSYANIHIKGDTATRILREFFPDTQLRTKVVKVYNAELNNNTPKNTLSAESIAKICDAAGWDRTKDKAKRASFRNALINAADDQYTYYEVCGKDKGKIGKDKEYCIENVFYAVVNGIDVQLSQAIELSKEYALVKYKDDVACSATPRPSGLNDYIKCTSKLKPVYYEFKFDDVNQSTNTEIYKDVIRGVGNIHGVAFKDSGCDIINISRDTRCTVGYKTTDKSVCENLSKSLKRFGMRAEVRNVVSGQSINDAETFCAVSFVENQCTGAREYGIDDTVFSEIQYPLTPTLENYVKDYIIKQLNAKNIQVSSFKCDKIPERDSRLLGAQYKLTCYVNDKCIKFPFEDLSESANYSKNAALSRLACIKHGGTADGKNCRGLKEDQCAELGKKIKASGQAMGTHYDRVRGGCILNMAVLERDVNLLGEVAAGIAITLVTDGTATIPVAVSIGTDLAFEAVTDWQRTIPYKDYQEFITHVMDCAEDKKSGMQDAIRISKINSVENKYCLAETVKEHYKLVVGQIDKLAPEDQKILSEVFTNIIANIGDAEYIKKASQSEISLLKQGRNLAQAALLAGVVLVHPQKILSQFDNVTRDIARLRYSASKNFTQYLYDFKRFGKNVGLPVQRLNGIEWQTLNKNLTNEGVELFEKDGFMWFRKLNTVTDVKSLLSRFNKTPVLRPGSANSLGYDYYRVVINDTDNVDDIIKTLKNNGFYVSANQTESGEKFIGVARENIFGAWDESPYNWLSGYTGGSVRGRGIFDKVYNDVPEDVLRRKLDYVYSVKAKGGSNHDIIEAMKRVGAFDEYQAGLLAQDIANETISRISRNPNLLARGRNWQSLSKNEKKQFVAEVHDIITQERRAKAGDTIISFENEGAGKNGWHRAPYGNQGRAFNYNIEEYRTVEDALRTIIHENTHSFQSVYKSSIPAPFAQLSSQHYVRPKENFKDYQNVLIEIEARYVAEHSAPKVSKALGW